MHHIHVIYNGEIHTIGHRNDYTTLDELLSVINSIKGEKDEKVQTQSK